MAQTRTEIQARYDSKNAKNYTLKFNMKYDSDVIEKLDSVQSKNGYIKQLIKQDIIRTCSVPVSENTMSILEDEAAKTGKPVPDIVNLIINDWIVRNC